MKIAWFDEKLLDWYFSQTDFERSPTGAILERAYEFQGGARRDIERKNAERSDLRAERRAAERRGEAIGPRPIDPLPITAQPTGGQQTSPGRVPDDRALTSMATVSRRLNRIDRFGAPTTTRVLEVYYGPVGVQFQAASLSRVKALYHLTAAGRTLLERADQVFGQGIAELPIAERMKVHLMLRDTRRSRASELDGVINVKKVNKARSRYAELSELFRKADREAEALYERACQDWRASGQKKAPDT